MTTVCRKGLREGENYKKVRQTWNVHCNTWNTQHLQSPVALKLKLNTHCITTWWQDLGSNVSCITAHVNEQPLMPGTCTHRPKATYLKAQATPIETGLVHGCVLADEPPAEIFVSQWVQLPMFVVAEQMLCQVEQCTQLTKRHAVHVHLASVVLNTEKHPTAVGGNVATLLDYMEYTGKNHLPRRQKQTFCSGCNKHDYWKVMSM